MQSPLSFALLVSVLFCPQLRADWLEFRGPTGQGLADAKLPVEWSEDKNIAWKTELPGLAWASPLVKGGLIYLTTAVDVSEGDEPAFDLKLQVVNKNTGELVREQTVFEQIGKVQMHKKNSHASSTSVIEGDRIYVHFGSNGTAALTLDGDVIWKRTLEYKPTHGNGGSPAIAGDVLVICCDGSNVQYVVGLDKNTGEVIWKTDRDTDPKKGFSFGTPLVIEVNGQQQAICTGSDTVFAYNPANGEEIWRANYPGGYSISPRPVYGGGLVYLSSSFDKPRLLAIDPTGSGDVTESHVKWIVDRNMPHTPSPLLVNGRVYIISDKGIATCIDAESGETIWMERIGGNFSASPLYSDGKIYLQDENGVTTVIAEGAEFKELAQNEINSGRTFASYAVDGNAIILRSETALYRIEE